MFMKSFYKSFIILFLLISSCSSKKDIIYFQNQQYDIEQDYYLEKYFINEGDILKIQILTDVNSNIASSIAGSPTSNINVTRESLIFSGYTVDNDGYIDYPQIGKIKISGLTLEDAKISIASKLKDFDILTNPIVDIKVLNWNFTILGEVSKPGNYFYDDFRLNLITALGMAGDLNISGKRKEIRLMRFYKDKYKVYEIDITDKDIFNNSFFQIKSGDIIIVNPNTSRIKNAGIIGNTGSLTGIASILISLIILFTQS